MSQRYFFLPLPLWPPKGLGPSGPVMRSWCGIGSHGVGRWSSTHRSGECGKQAS